MAGQLGQRRLGLLHLDGGHAELAGRLQVAADVVEEDRVSRRNAERLTGVLVAGPGGVALAGALLIWRRRRRGSA
jgi:hypothetical protein